MQANDTLLEQSWIKWLLADWEDLARLDESAIRDHPDRARLALFAALGHQQMGEDHAVEHYVQLALTWGCERDTINRMLIGGLHQVMGDLLLMQGQEQRALVQFRQAVETSCPGDDAHLVASIRIHRRLQHLGIPSNSLSHQLPLATTQDFRERFSVGAYSRYVSISTARRHSSQFVLLDCKSLPRSGLHFLAGLLATFMGDHFSFCEWYQEPGCCRKFPCALTGYATESSAGTARIRMIKSHDFDLTDPVYEPVFSLRRVILVRDPLYMLSSWFALDALRRHASLLAEHSIRLSKIYFRHEPEVLDTAYRIVDDAFSEPGPEELADWLEKRSSYITGFLKKWAGPGSHDPARFRYIVRYEELEKFALSLLYELREHLPPATRDLLEGHDPGSGMYQPRRDPFTVRSVRLSEYLRRNADRFRDAARKIMVSEHASFLREPVGPPASGGSHE